MSHRALLAAAGAQGKTFVEDVFSAYPYTGNNSTLTITNGVDLTKGGLVWTRGRPNVYNHHLVDTARGVGNALFSNLTSGQSAFPTGITAFSSTGYALGNDANYNYTDNYVSWTFRRAARFFDVVTWTGDGTSNRQIPHALGIAPGMVTAKRRDSTGDWAVWHRSATGDLYLDTTAAQTASFTQITAASATTFSVSGNANINGATYVAYAWAHDPDTVNGIVQCGSYTTDAGGNSPVVNLGWEPQYLMVKCASGTQQWSAFDTSRGMSLASNTAELNPSSSAAESVTAIEAYPSASGFSLTSAYGIASRTYIYLAIRRGPMRTPTSGTQVYNAIARTGTGAAATVTGVGFAPDLLLGMERGGGAHTAVVDRLRGRSQILKADISAAEPAASTSTQDVVSFDPNGISFGTPSNVSLNTSAATEIDWLLARAPGFFDIVCYKGTGANQTLAHNLGVAPKMMWIKDRTTANDWAVYHQSVGAGQALILDSSAAAVANTAFLNNTAPTATGLTVGVDAKTNTSGDNYVAYLFGQVPGISSIGSYTGNGAAQTINCGFTNGARFVLIKRVDAAGYDWIAMDSVRGLSGTAPYLKLDTTDAESTLGAMALQSSGFGFSASTGVNLAGATYIYFAVA